MSSANFRSLLFQFHKVRLKDNDCVDTSATPVSFQFHKVRLKVLMNM